MFGGLLDCWLDGCGWLCVNSVDLLVLLMWFRTCIALSCSDSMF